MLPPDLGRTVTYCAKHDLGGCEGLIGVPGTVGGALAHECRRVRHANRQLRSRSQTLPGRRPTDEILSGDQISFEYRHTSFAPDDMMLAVTLELPSKSYQEIIQEFASATKKRRASQPLGQKSAGCIFKNPPAPPRAG